MLKQCIAVLLTLLVGRAAAQNNLIVLTENGAFFTLFVNDAQVNDSAQSIVQARKLFDDSCALKMVFVNKNLPPFSTHVFLTVNGRAVAHKDFTYSLKTEKGKSTLNFISVNESRSDTTQKPQAPEKKINSIFIDLEKRKAEEDKLAERYPPPSNCKTVISDSMFAAQISILRTEHIERNRMKDAKWFVSHQCINTPQLAQLMGAFDTQGSKVKIAEFCYDYVEDKGNFLDVLDALKFTTEQEELKTFYQKQTEK